jgi:serine O-acetyltransferase
MFVRLVVKLLGGIWRVRERCEAANFKLSKRFFSALYTYHLQTMGASIPLSTRFAGPPFFPHGPYGVFMSGAAIIGKNCVIFQHVMIASNSLMDSKRMGAPTIGDNCYIGVGAKIIGSVNIGNNVRVAANAFVYDDVPENCLVTCGPQRVVENRKRQNNRFYHKYHGAWRYCENGSWTMVKDSQELLLLEKCFPDAHVADETGQ